MLGDFLGGGVEEGEEEEGAGGPEGGAEPVGGDEAAVGGGLALVLGFHTRIVAAILAAFAIVTAFAFHHDLADQGQFINFWKNVAMAGGLLQVVAFGAGRFSLDARR